uniref:Protein tweety homolog n=1 Tax=Cyprinodon variegatus TaxID=28743 RepID=A0A3Q2D6J7_CYPVA
MQFTGLFLLIVKPTPPALWGAFFLVYISEVYVCFFFQGTSDFCVSPDKYLNKEEKLRFMLYIVHYYLYCNQTRSNPFQQPLTIFQRSLTTMQIQIQGLLQFAVPLFPTAEVPFNLLNSSEASLHQLTALLDCRGLNKDYLDAMVGVCYDGVEGVLYLCLFSILAACAFTVMLCAIPRALRQIASRSVCSHAHLPAPPPECAPFAQEALFHICITCSFNTHH